MLPFRDPANEHRHRNSINRRNPVNNTITIIFFIINTNITINIRIFVVIIIMVVVIVTSITSIAIGILISDVSAVLDKSNEYGATCRSIPLR